MIYNLDTESKKLRAFESRGAPHSSIARTLLGPPKAIVVSTDEASNLFRVMATRFKKKSVL